MAKLEEVVALAKRRGFVYPGSEIYGGLKGFWDYGPLGVELKNNIKSAWWNEMVYGRDDVVGIDAAIIMNPKVWEVSGHTEAFTDPLVECKKCHKRFREDHVEERKKIHKKIRYKTKGVSNITLTNEDKYYLFCSDGVSHEFTEPRVFNLLTEVFLGVTEPKQKTYLRGEVTQGVFVNFKNILDSTSMKVPFGIAQIGKAFRNEITPGNFTYRTREFEQMELEYFIKPDEQQAEKTFEYWKKERMDWYISLGMTKENLRFRKHGKDERAHYAKFAEDIEYKAPFGWSEFEGIHHRGDWDLGRHKVAVFPLLANKPKLVEKARKVFGKLRLSFHSTWDDRGNIGKRYYAQDEIGTPWCVTIDFKTLDDDTVTVRDRDTTKQERVNITKLIAYFDERLKT